MSKNWKIAQPINQEFQNRFPEIHPLILQLLWNRGLTTQEKIDEFLLPDYSQDLHDPFLFNEMTDVVKRIKKAIDQKEKITIYGDYDADGVSSTAILYLTLQKIGADVFYYLPDREKEGYGMNKEAIKKIFDEGTKLIITVDCGITNIEEVEFAKNLGIEVIITDHHLPLKNIPQSLFIINPWLKKEKYPFKDLAGAGVAFKVAQALLRYIYGRQDHQQKGDVSIETQKTKVEAFEKWLLDLVALGSVADVVSLKGENRVLVKYGLIVLNKTSRIGLRHLIKKAKINFGEIDTRSIGLQIASRVNAAGRIDHANLALEMVVAQDKEKAIELADKLQELNGLRQKRMEKIFEEAKQEIGDNPKDKILIISKDNWPVGLLGITSHRLLDIYNRPSVLISIREHEIKGCGRSVEGVNLIEILKKLENYLSRYGGHSGAAGFTLKENNRELLKEFCQKLKQIAEEDLKDLDLRPKIFIDAELNLKDLTWSLYEEIKKFEPFGEDNPPPVFLARGLTIEKIIKVGKDGQHLKIIVEGGKKMIYFGGGESLSFNDLGKKIDVVFDIKENQWNGKKEMELKVLDLRKC